MRHPGFRFLIDEKAATAIEYAFIASLVSILIVGGAMALGTDLSDIFSSLASSF